MSGGDIVLRLDRSSEAAPNWLADITNVEPFPAFPPSRRHMSGIGIASPMDGISGDADDAFRKLSL